MGALARPDARQCVSGVTGRCAYGVSPSCATRVAHRQRAAWRARNGGPPPRVNPGMRCGIQEPSTTRKAAWAPPRDSWLQP